MRTLVWFRGKDLRLGDHAPLVDAAHKGELICLFVLDPYFFAPERARELPHRLQFLLESLADLAAELQHRGSCLVLARGRSVEVVPQLARTWRADRVVAHRWSEPFARQRDAQVAAALPVPLELWEGETLAPPGTLRTADGRPFSVFTAYARAHRLHTTIGEPLPAPRRLPPLPPDIEVPRPVLPTLAELGLVANPRILPGGERAARARLSRFLAGAAAHYDTLRDRPDLDATSRLSVDLKFGTLSARAVWTAAQKALQAEHPEAWLRFSSELLWREFAYSVLWENPTLLTQPRRPEFAAFPWQENALGWRAWCAGTTGYPIVDAAARQLLSEGFVHNRARMIAASFLTRDLLIDYRRGEAHYLKYLTDGDWAANNLGWQWCTGCGFDAQPYFRVFNPAAQGEKFDPQGDYVRRWVPELGRLPARHIHCPAAAPAAVLAAAGVRLGSEYPLPIVDHRYARDRFLVLAQRHLKRAPEQPQSVI